MRETLPSWKESESGQVLHIEILTNALYDQALAIGASRPAVNLVALVIVAHGFQDDVNLRRCANYPTRVLACPLVAQGMVVKLKD